jgi:hypothetical protein
MDLLHAAPEDEVHLAFSVDRETFDAVLARIREHNIAFGTHRGAGALYFYDPDGHNLELRVYAESVWSLTRAALAQPLTVGWWCDQALVFILPGQHTAKRRPAIRGRCHVRVCRPVQKLEHAFAPYAMLERHG